MNCVNHIEKLNPKNIAFPFKIGCGLAGGSLNTYINMINQFSLKTKIEIKLYKL
jgi:hypothetical protein